jgi:hypothetical protein
MWKRWYWFNYSAIQINSTWGNSDLSGITSISTAGSPPAIGDHSLLLRSLTSATQLSIGIDGYNSSWLQSYQGDNNLYKPILLNPLGGSIGIGVSSPSQLLHVGGTTLTNKLFVGTVDNTHAGSYIVAVHGNAIFTKVVVKLYTNWSDYVFEPNYQLRSLASLEEYINQNKHLPGTR